MICDPSHFSKETSQTHCVVTAPLIVISMAALWLPTKHLVRFERNKRYIYIFRGATPVYNSSGSRETSIFVSFLWTHQPLHQLPSPLPLPLPFKKTLSNLCVCVSDGESMCVYTCFISLYWMTYKGNKTVTMLTTPSHMTFYTTYAKHCNRFKSCIIGYGQHGVREHHPLP